MLNRDHDVKLDLAVFSRNQTDNGHSSFDCVVCLFFFSILK